MLRNHVVLRIPILIFVALALMASCLVVVKPAGAVAVPARVEAPAMMTLPMSPIMETALHEIAVASGGEISVTFGWVIYIYFNHAETGSILLTAFLAGVGSAAAVACSVATMGWVAPLCVGVFAFLTAYLISLFGQAYTNGDGLVLEVEYFGDYFGYQEVKSWNPNYLGPTCGIIPGTNIVDTAPCPTKGMTV